MSKSTRTFITAIVFSTIISYASEHGFEYFLGLVGISYILLLMCGCMEKYIDGEKKA